MQWARLALELLLRAAPRRQLAEAGCSPHEIMSVSGHEILREVERHTKAANRARMANSAIAALQTAQKEAAELGKRDSKLANTPGVVSQNSDQTSVFKEEKIEDGGGGGIRTLETVSRLHTFQACAFSHSATPPARVRTIAVRMEIASCDMAEPSGLRAPLEFDSQHPCG
jgi:hypothetical protein